MTATVAATTPGDKFAAGASTVVCHAGADQLRQRRPLAWQSLAPSSVCGTAANPPNSSVVRERYWVAFQRGEIRACNSCHGVNQTNQGGAPTPANQPQALADLLAWWQQHGDSIFADQFGP